jgi:hypothetical protein
MKMTLPPLSTMVANARPYAMHGGALALVALIGWIIGSRVGDVAGRESRGADGIASPTWQRFEAGPARARALEIARFVTDPSEIVAAAAPELEEDPESKGVTRPDDAWRFIGTAVNGEDTVAFIMVGKPSKLVMLSGSDQLPNGEQIVGIEQDKLRYTKDGQSMEATLFERTKK